MKVSLNKIFPMQHSIDSAWQCLSDIELVAGCMPGAEITEKVDAHNYKGKVKVRLGPVTMAFNGDIEVKSIDAEKLEIQLIASGQDSKGTSSAGMDLTASIRTAESSVCELVGDADVTVNGKLANFGGRMMNTVADQILAQFFDHFNDRVKEIASNANSATGADSDNVSAEQTPTKQKPNELNGLSFIWNIFIDLFKKLFSRPS